MSGDLTIRWAGGTKSFSPGTDVRIGRDPGVDVVVDNPNVSRLHAIVSHDGTAWVLRDQGSFQGTFRQGQAVSELRLGASESVTLGSPQVGVSIDFSVGEDAAPTRARETPTDAVDTVVPNRESRPGGALRDDVFDSATVVGGESLRVECGGKTYQFSPGKHITLGRDASADVVSTNPTVSRSHATVTHDGEGWKIEDAGSSAGTFIDGRRIQSARLTGSTAVWLGDPDTGERVVIVASGQKEATPIDRVRRLGRSSYLGIAAVLFGVVAIGVAIFALSNQGSGALDRDQMARGVVRIETSEGILGSGTVIDAEEGLILTNAHVAAPRSLGQGVLWNTTEDELAQNPRLITIWVSDGLDEIAEPRFVAEVVAVDGYLDLAVLRITETAGGSIVDDSDLEELVEIPIGDADDLESGDPIQILGYPGVAQSNAATLTAGVLSGTVQDARLGSNRAFINLDAEIRGGNSGGLVADANGRIVGVPTLDWTSDREQVASMRPISFAMDLIEAARAEEDYVSEFVTAPTGNEEFPTASFVSASDVGFRSGCSATAGGVSTGDTQVSLAINYEGFAAVEHQDLGIAIFEEATGQRIGFASTADDWPIEFAEDGCVTVTVNLGSPLQPGLYFVDFYIGPNYVFDPGMSLPFEL